MPCYLSLQRIRSAKGGVTAGHLIHHYVVPLPLKGKDNTPLQLRLDFHCRTHCFTPARPRAFAHLYGRLSLPLVGEGGPLAVDEVIPLNIDRFGQNDHQSINEA